MCIIESLSVHLRLQFNWTRVYSYIKSFICIKSVLIPCTTHTPRYTGTDPKLQKGGGGGYLRVSVTLLVGELFELKLVLILL